MGMISIRGANDHEESNNERNNPRPADSLHPQALLSPSICLQKHGSFPVEKTALLIVIRHSVWNVMIITDNDSHVNLTIGPMMNRPLILRHGLFRTLLNPFPPYKSSAGPALMTLRPSPTEYRRSVHK